MNKAAVNGKIMMTDQNISENLLLLVPFSFVAVVAVVVLILGFSYKRIEFKN